MNRAFTCLLVCIFFVGCSSLENSISFNEGHIPQDLPEYSIIYIVHGDANYLYHKDGASFQADEEVLKESFSVAAGAKTGEVFIFHQKPERKAFFFFPKKDRVLYHFINGQLISKSKYSPFDGGLSKELSLFKSKTSASSKSTYLAYFGHEIPLKSGLGYHRTSKDKIFVVPVFISGLKKLNRTFDLITLSVCNGGNPYLIDELSSLSKAVVTSPQNLHLSHLDTFSFNLLETNRSISAVELADSIAKKSFEELTSFVETEITIATYSMTEVKKYSSSFSHLYKEEISKSSKKELEGDNWDCENIQNYDSIFRTGGVRSYYKSSSFGRNSNKKTHSGWGCKL